MTGPVDFVRILHSLEELLYEVMSWLIFYPRTLWRAVRHPFQMLRYSDRELRDASEDQFSDLLSPPLFLLLTILLSHLIEIAAHQSLPGATTTLGKQIMASDQNLLILRATLFSVYPLMFAVLRLNSQKLPLNRNTLRAPFFAQCYIAAPAAFAFGIAAILVRAAHPAIILSGFGLALCSVGWYMTIETIWLRGHARMTRTKAFGTVLIAWLVGCGINSLASFLILGT